MSTEKEEFEFFWDGIFSQWYPSEFRDSIFMPEGYKKVRFSCAEQYMMVNKALVFNDTKIATKILNTNSPREQKALGREVANFNEQKWNSVAREIVYRGNYFKFTQDKELLADLLATAPKILVEASPYDKVWGIGLAEDDKRALNRSTWQGKNWLGETLTKLRNDLIAYKNNGVNYAPYSPKQN